MNVLEYTMNKNQSWITKSKTDKTSQTAVKKRSVVRITTLLEPPYASRIDGVPKKNNYNISELQGYWNPFKIEKMLRFNKKIRLFRAKTLNFDSKWSKFPQKNPAKRPKIGSFDLKMVIFDQKNSFFWLKLDKFCQTRLKIRFWVENVPNSRLRKYTIFYRKIFLVNSHFWLKLTILNVKKYWFDEAACRRDEFYLFNQCCKRWRIWVLVS